MAFAPEGFTERYRNVVTAWVAVDPATPENGCLQFVPGSHRAGILPHIGDQEHADGQPRREQAVEPHVDPQVLAAHPAPVEVPLDPRWDLAEEHRVGQPDAIAQRRDLQVPVVIVDRGGHVTGEDRDRDHAGQGFEKGH